MRPSRLRTVSRGNGQKSSLIGRKELIRDPGTQDAGAKAEEVEVEIGMHRHELADVDALMAFVQPFRRLAADRIVIAGD